MSSLDWCWVRVHDVHRLRNEDVEEGSSKNTSGLLPRADGSSHRRWHGRTCCGVRHSRIGDVTIPPQTYLLEGRQYLLVAARQYVVRIHAVLTALDTSPHLGKRAAGAIWSTDQTNRSKSVVGSPGPSG
jgi:hypothetical protein